MNLGIIAHNSKKVLIEDFCIAYKNILAKHEVYATGTTGRRIEEATSLHVHKFLAGSIGGDKQFMEMVERQDLDMVILFYNPVMMDPAEPDIMSIVKRCDQYNIPVATNIATAELLILGLAVGKVSYLFETMNRLRESFPIDSSYLTVLVKIIGITYIGQFSSAICKDAGYQMIGTQIDLFCKLSVMVLSMPVLLALLDTIQGFLV